MQNPARHPGAAPRWAREDGYTIVEIMVAIVVLLIGVLGTLSLFESAASSTSRTNARDGGTNLARDLVERARQLSYADVSAASAPANLRGTLPASDNVSTLSGSSFEVTRRGTTYTVEIMACSIDDPTDGAGQGDSKYCEAPEARVVAGTDARYAAAVNVLGIPVTAGGSLLATVCNAVGTNVGILDRLTAAVSRVAPISACPAGIGPGTAAVDTTPDDLRRVYIDVTWRRGGQNGSLRQTTLLTDPQQ